MVLLRIIACGIALSTLVSCATIMKSERASVTFVGGPESGDAKIDLPDGQYTMRNGRASVLVTRSKEDIPISVTCNAETRDGVIKTSFDALAGVGGNLIFGGLIGLAVDLGGSKVYDPPVQYNVSHLCSKEKPAPVASTSETRSPASAGK